MEALEIVDKINELPTEQRMLIAEMIIRSVRKAEQQSAMRKAAELAYDDYKNDKELTIFTLLDGEDFYEAR
jgi:hypothetical protein